MIDINVKLPELETVKLEHIHIGDVFMLPNKTNSHINIPQALVYMPISSGWEPNIDCVCLNNGDIKKINRMTRVIRLRATIECKYISPNDDDDLPF